MSRRAPVWRVAVCVHTPPASYKKTDMSNQTVHFFLSSCATKPECKPEHWIFRFETVIFLIQDFLIQYRGCIVLVYTCLQLVGALRRTALCRIFIYLEAKPIATFAIVQRKNNCALCATMCFIDVFICLWGCLCLWGIVCLSLKLSLYLGCLWLWRFLYIGFHICLMYVCVMLVCMHVLCICLCDCMRVCMYACLVYVSYVCLMYTYIHNRAMHVFCVCFVCIDMFQKYLT